METLRKNIENLGTAGALMSFEPLTSCIQAKGPNVDSYWFSTVRSASQIHIDLPGKYGNHLKIPGARSTTHGTFHTQGQKILGVTSQGFVLSCCTFREISRAKSLNADKLDFLKFSRRFMRFPLCRRRERASKSLNLRRDGEIMDFHLTCRESGHSRLPLNFWLFLPGQSIFIAPERHRVYKR